MPEAATTGNVIVLDGTRATFGSDGWPQGDAGTAVTP
jgi:hypothetical protein